MGGRRDPNTPSPGEELLMFVKGGEVTFLF